MSVDDVVLFEKINNCHLCGVRHILMIYRRFYSPGVFHQFVF